MSDQQVNVDDESSYSDSRRENIFGRGVLHVEILEARGIKGDEIGGIGKADPYLKLKHGSSGKREILKSTAHQDGGSNPVWNFQFCFPLRNGGTKDHNILEIEIYNENKHTSLFRGDNLLGHLRIGGLAEWITKHELCITEPAWYPVFYKHHRSSRDQTEEEKQGEILMKFYFQNVDDEVFALGHHHAPTCGVINHDSLAVNRPGDIRQAKYKRVVTNKSSAKFGTVATAVGIAQTLIMITDP